MPMVLGLFGSALLVVLCWWCSVGSALLVGLCWWGYLVMLCLWCSVVVLCCSALFVVPELCHCLSHVPSHTHPHQSTCAPHIDSIQMSQKKAHSLPKSSS